ncbi:MAG: hypothetical protein Q8R58_00080 [Sulfuricurvum sp.]|jgi:hypothetical protein|nr:hypothetical protein [Sulfuricurvum sp.]
MTIEDIKERNTKILNHLIEKYKIKFSVDELINNFRTIYLHKVDSEMSEIRVQGAQTLYNTYEQNGEIHRIASKKTLNTAIFTLRKKAIIIYNQEDRLEIVHAMNTFVRVIHEMHLINDLETFESEFQILNYGCYIDQSSSS